MPVTQEDPREVGRSCKEYVASTVGAAVGLLLGLVIAFLFVVSSFDYGLPGLSPSDVLLQVVLPIFGLSVLGCYWGLRLIGAARAAATSWVCAVIDVVGLTVVLSTSLGSILILPGLAIMSPLAGRAFTELMHRY